MGSYPLFTCHDWSGLETDLQALEGELVSAMAVIDPLAEVTEAQLRRAFPDLVRPLKDHYLVDLTHDPKGFVDAQHRRKARRALARTSVEVIDRPSEWTADWLRLYADLVRHHAMVGMAAFNPRALQAQLEVPGAVAVRALQHGTTVAMLVWYVQGPAAYYHLGASNAEGYALGASFGLFWESLKLFAERGVRVLELGGGAGTQANADDGLNRFKRGWSTSTRTALLCGRILDAPTYHSLSQRAGHDAQDYFPRYRAGEFV
jgi:hypothetical protein